MWVSMNACLEGSQGRILRRLFRLVVRLHIPCGWMVSSFLLWLSFETTLSSSSLPGAGMCLQVTTSPASVSSLVSVQFRRGSVSCPAASTPLDPCLRPPCHPGSRRFLGLPSHEWWCLQPSQHLCGPLCSSAPSPLASESFVVQLFSRGGQSVGFKLQHQCPMNTQGWSLQDLVRWDLYKSKGAQGLLNYHS